MDRLNTRVRQALDDLAATGEAISEVDLTRRLAPEFSSVCGQAEVRAAIVNEMRRRTQGRVQSGLSAKLNR